MNLNCSSGSILIDGFDPSNFPLALIIGIDVVIYFEFFVEVVGFELGDGFFEHKLNIYLRKIYFELIIAMQYNHRTTYKQRVNLIYLFSYHHIP